MLEDAVSCRGLSADGQERQGRSADASWLWLLMMSGGVDACAGVPRVFGLVLVLAWHRYRLFTPLVRWCLKFLECRLSSQLSVIVG